MGLAALALAGPTSAGAASRLPTFDSCAQLIAYGNAHTGSTGAVARPGVTPQTTNGAEGSAPASSDTVAPDDMSTTNVQEAGVDEPDVVKTDGATLFAIAGSTLFAIDARADAPRIVGSLALPAGSGHELLVHDGRALVISRGPWAIGPIEGPMPVDSAPAGTAASPPARPASILPQRAPTTVLSELDVRDPAAMRLVRTLSFDGSPVGARLTGATARVVVSSSPLIYAYPDARTTAAGWIPPATLAGPGGAGARTAPLVPCGSVRRPRVFSGTGLLSVLTIDLDRGLPALDVDSLMTDAQIVYAAPRSLYVATQRYDPMATSATTIHRFDTSEADRTTYAASGSVPGHLLSSFALSEDGGVLRAASTTDPWSAGSEGESFVTTLRERDGRLAELGSVRGIGRGERIYAVRFAGPLAYVVTFRQTDPLFTIDLSDPAAPAVAGKLDLLGYSAYLHPIGDARLLGIGQDADAGGRTSGAQVSLFDVSDPAHPKRLAAHSLGAHAWTQAESEHHAFLWWPATRLAVLPLERSDFTGAIGLRVGRDAIDELGRVEHAGQPLLRSTVVGRRLFSLAADGVQVSALSTLAPQSWVAFPAG
jgi:beta propeller domain-containing protein